MPFNGSTTQTDNTALLRGNTRGGGRARGGLDRALTLSDSSWQSAGGGSVEGGLHFPSLDTDRLLDERFSSWCDDAGLDFGWECFLRKFIFFLNDRGVGGWGGRGFMWFGPSAAMWCPGGEGPGRSTPSAGRPWRGGWGPAGGRPTRPVADSEGWTRRCPRPMAGRHPADTKGSKVKHQEEQDVTDKDEMKWRMSGGAKVENNRTPLLWIMKKVNSKTTTVYKRF